MPGWPVMPGWHLLRRAVRRSRINAYLLRALLWPRPSLAGLWLVTLALFLGAAVTALGDTWSQTVLAPSLHLAAFTAMTLLLLPFQAQLAQLGSRKTLALDGKAMGWLCLWGALIAGLWALNASALIHRPGDGFPGFVMSASLIFASLSLVLLLGIAWRLDNLLSLVAGLWVMDNWEPLEAILQMPDRAPAGYLPALCLLTLGLWWLMKRRMELGQIGRPLSEMLLELLLSTRASRIRLSPGHKPTTQARPKDETEGESATGGK